MKMLGAILMLSVSCLGATFEFEDGPGALTNRPTFYLLWRHQGSSPVQWLRIVAPTNPPPRTVSFAAELPLGTNTISVTAHTPTEASPRSNQLFFTNAPVSAPVVLRLATMQINVSLVVTGAVTFTP